MTKANKLGLEDLKVVAEEQLGIDMTAKSESEIAVESGELTEAAIIELQNELSYLEYQFGSAKEASEYMLQKYIAATKAATVIKEQHKIMKEKVEAEEKELLALKKNLLMGAVVLDGVSIPKQKEDSPIIERIDGALKQVGNSMKRVANIIANDYGFEDANEVFAYFKEK